MLTADKTRNIRGNLGQNEANNNHQQRILTMTAGEH